MAVAQQRDGVPIWARPEPGARRPRFSREQIAAAALAIADAEGFAAVSMRRIATELGAGTMTLYHYVRTKDELVALMDDALMAESLIPDDELPTGWRPAITEIAHRTRAALVRHPWALVSLRDAQMGPNAMRHFEQSLRAVADTELDYAAKVTFLTIVDDYVMGHVLRVEEINTRTERTKDDEVAAAIEFGLAQLATGLFPLTSKLYEETQQGGGMLAALGPDATQHRFQIGLDALLDGLAAGMRLPPS
jgi:AcrR family transcriptional regulator